MAHNTLLIIPYVLFIIIISLILGKIIGPFIGNLICYGVPQIEAIFLNKDQMYWWAML